MTPKWRTELLLVEKYHDDQHDEADAEPHELGRMDVDAVFAFSQRHPGATGASVFLLSSADNRTSVLKVHGIDPKSRSGYGRRRLLRRWLRCWASASVRLAV